MEPILDEYFSYLENDKKVSENTLDSYRRDILKYTKYLHDLRIGEVQDCTKTVILNYLLSM